MDLNRIIDLPVVTLAGVNVGTVAQIFVDPKTKRIACFVLATELDRPGVSPRIVDADDVHALGEDALILPNATAARDAATSARLSGLLRLDEMVKRQVMTESGTSWPGRRDRGRSEHPSTQRHRSAVWLLQEQHTD